MHKLHLHVSLQQYFPVQLLFVLGIIAILIMVAVKEYDQPKVKAYATEALTTAGIIKQEITLYHAITGTWPDTKDLPALFAIVEEEPLYKGVEVKNGSFKISFDTQYPQFGTRDIAFHRVELLGATPATVFWDCGSSPVIANTIIHKEFKSNLSERYMPSVCKQKAN